MKKQQKVLLQIGKTVNSRVVPIRKPRVTTYNKAIKIIKSIVEKICERYKIDLNLFEDDNALECLMCLNDGHSEVFILNNKSLNGIKNYEPLDWEYQFTIFEVDTDDPDNPLDTVNLI